MNICLDLCESATTEVNFTYGNRSINQDSALWPIGFKMLRPMNGYLVRGLNRDVMRICNVITIHRSWFSSVTVKTNATCREKLAADVVENVGLKLQFSC